MVKLNLEAKDNAQQRILDYLQENVSEVLADKINNGVQIEKDSKQLINKKTLDCFMNYATEQAKKTVENDARSACIEDSVVYGWAIHYFEEDSIEGVLYNLDGTEYKPVVKKTTTKTKAPNKPQAKEQPKDMVKQQSFFDILNDTQDIEQVEEQQVNVDNVSIEEEFEEISVVENTDNEKIGNEQKPCENRDITENQVKKPLSSFYVNYMEICERYPDSVIIQRLGDFYEILEQDAIDIAEKLDLTLINRDVGLVDRVPMIGFPYHAKDMYLNKIRQDYNVVVVDNGNIEKLPQIVVANIQIIDKATGEILEEVCDNNQASFVLNECEQYIVNLLGDIVIVK